MLAVAYAKVLLGLTNAARIAHAYISKALWQSGVRPYKNRRWEESPESQACLHVFSPEMCDPCFDLDGETRVACSFSAPNSAAKTVQGCDLLGSWALCCASCQRHLLSLHRWTRTDASARGEAIGRSPRSSFLLIETADTQQSAARSLSQWWCAPQSWNASQNTFEGSQAERAPELFIAQPNRCTAANAAVASGIFQAASLMCLHAEVTKYRPRRAN